jgi:hypothetical protein
MKKRQMGDKTKAVEVEVARRSRGIVSLSGLLSHTGGWAIGGRNRDDVRCRESDALSWSRGVQKVQSRCRLGRKGVCGWEGKVR